MTGAVRQAPLIAHVLYRFGTGGLENGLVNIINRTPPERYRHALVCLTDAEPFLARIRVPDLQVVELNRRPGHDFALYGRLWSALRALRPSIVHTRNLGTLEGQIPAALLPGVCRVHGEHGRDVFDIAGTNRKYNLLRRGIRPLVQRYVAVSRDLAHWLEATVGVQPGRIRQIYNGVDLARFAPRSGPRPDLAPLGFLPADALVVGTVGRLAEVKDQATLIAACANLLGKGADAASRLRLVIVGDGALRGQLERQAAIQGIGDRVWFAGDRKDVPDLMRLFDLFVLPSLGEGISNTVLEAMASGLAVVATRVGGNPELVEERRTGALVPVADPETLAEVMLEFLTDDDLRARCGAAARESVGRRFSWERCVEQYLGLYDELLGRAAEPALLGVGKP
ncbi:MAG: TIGR03088 family PEP-CTERM/XrtA system glycosyltransferase [Chromatiaceae bacterium]